MKSYSLEELKTLLKVGAKKQELNCGLAETGVPLGGVTQVVGHGKTEWALELCQKNPKSRVAWIEECFSIYPLTFVQHGLALENILFVDAREHVAWATQQVLRSQCFSLVVMYSEILEANIVRRLQLEAEKSNTALVWLSSKNAQAWSVNLKVEASLMQHARMLKRRFG